MHWSNTFWSALIVGIFAIGFAKSAAAQQVISDSSFGSWSTEVCPNVPLVTSADVATSTQDAGVGATAPSLRIDHEWFVLIAGCHLKQNATISFNSAGASQLRFAFDAKLTAGGRQGMNITPLIRQNGVYYQGPSQNYRILPWQGLAQGTLSADDFFPVGDRDSTQRPDFSCGASPIEVGVVSANSGRTASGLTRSAHIDNFEVEPIDLETCMPDFGDITVIDGLIDSGTLPVLEVEITTFPDTCCPALDKSTLLSMLVPTATGGLNDPYTIDFVIDQTWANQWQAYLNYVAALDPQFTGITMSITEEAAGNGPTPVPSGSTNGSISMAWTVGGSGPTVTGSLGAVDTNEWYLFNVNWIPQMGSNLAFGPDCPIEPADLRIQVSSSRGQNPTVLFQTINAEGQVQTLEQSGRLAD